MPKRRFVQDREPPYDFYEVSDDYESVRNVPVVNDRHYDGLAATDGTPINSRAKHKAYMKRHGLTTMDDYTNEWADKAKKRDAFFRGEKGSGAVRREDVARAIHQLETEQRSRKRR